MGKDRGEEDRKGQTFDLIHSDDLQMDPAFQTQVRSVLSPGVTLVATDGGIQSGHAGTPVKLMDTSAPK